MSKVIKKPDAMAKASIENLVYQTVRNKIKRDEGEHEKKELAPALIELLRRHGLGQYSIDWGEGRKAMVSIRQRDNSKIDPERLKKALGAKTFNQLTTAVLDENKLQAAIQSGQVDPNVVAQCQDERYTEYVDVRFGKATK
jgi:hypothetical protein